MSRGLHLTHAFPHDFLPNLCSLASVYFLYLQNTNDEPVHGARGALARVPRVAWFVCASLHCIKVEKHEGRNEWGLAIQVVLNTVVAIILGC